jgi:poly(hydroxyalkanoate) depolymerase family esterase
LVYAPLISPARGYQLYFPTGYRQDERLPLVVMLHGCKQDAESFAASTRFNGLADRDRYLVLYPEQPRRANPYRCWNWFDPSSHKGNGEVAIIAGMVSKVAAEQNVDSSRVYLAGLSAGGALASALASCHAEMFAACAIHSGMMFQAASSPAAALPAMRDGSQRSPNQAGEDAYELSGSKVHSMPVLVIQGDADETVHPINAKQIVAQFLAMNKDALARNTPPRTTEKSDGSGYRYETRDYGAEVSPVLRHITVKGMGHGWSGGNANYPYNDARGPNASEMILEFFALHRREEDIPGHSEQREESAFASVDLRH